MATKPYQVKYSWNTDPNFGKDKIRFRRRGEEEEKGDTIVWKRWHPLPPVSRYCDPLAKWKKSGVDEQSDMITWRRNPFPGNSHTFTCGVADTLKKQSPLQDYNSLRSSSAEVRTPKTQEEKTNQRKETNKSDQEVLTRFSPSKSDKTDSSQNGNRTFPALRVAVFREDAIVEQPELVLLRRFSFVRRDCEQRIGDDRPPQRNPQPAADQELATAAAAPPEAAEKFPTPTGDEGQNDDFSPGRSDGQETPKAQEEVKKSDVMGATISEGALSEEATMSEGLLSKEEEMEEEEEKEDTTLQLEQSGASTSGYGRRNTTSGEYSVTASPREPSHIEEVPDGRESFQPSVKSTPKGNPQVVVTYDLSSSADDIEQERRVNVSMEPLATSTINLDPGLELGQNSHNLKRPEEMDDDHLMPRVDESFAFADGNDHPMIDVSADRNEGPMVQGQDDNPGPNELQFSEGSNKSPRQRVSEEGLDDGTEERARGGGVSARADLLLPVERVRGELKKSTSLRVGVNAAVYCTAVMESLTSHLMDIAINNAQDEQQNSDQPIITSKAVFDAVHEDDELQVLCKNVVIPISDNSTEFQP